MTSNYRKSTFSGLQCVEVAPKADGTVSLRNSRDADGPTLEYTREEWLAFLAGVRCGEFDFGLDVDALLARPR